MKTGKNGVQKGAPATKRCAVYTRKSTSAGLEQDFNSLDAQRDSCVGYIQRQPGWTLLDAHYDDGGFTGANIERPAFQRLLADIEGGKIDVVVVYKVDRLSRSLLDFAKVMERFRQFRRVVRLGHAELLDRRRDGTAHAQHADELRRVRTRNDRRAHSRQDCRRTPEGEVDGRAGTPRLLGRGKTSGRR